MNDLKYFKRFIAGDLTEEELQVYEAIKQAVHSGVQIDYITFSEQTEEWRQMYHDIYQAFLIEQLALNAFSVGNLTCWESLLNRLYSKSEAESIMRQFVGNK